MLGTIFYLTGCHFKACLGTILKHKKAIEKM